MNGPWSQGALSRTAPWARTDGPALSDGAVQVYWASPSQVDLSWARSLLDPGEQAKADRFRFEKDRALYTAAHAMLREVLALHSGVEARAFHFEAHSHGKPFTRQTEVRFNLSHTQGQVICAVSRTDEVGVDSEGIKDGRNLGEIADRHFAQMERDSLNQLRGADWNQRFFTLWSLKESYLKARGAGLSLRLDEARFSFDAGLRVDFEPASGQRVNDWFFATLPLEPGICSAVALWRHPQPA